MYPVLFRIGSFEATRFGVMVAVAALVGFWLFRRELRLSGLPIDATDAGIIGVIGGLLGAKLLWTAEYAKTHLVSLAAIAVGTGMLVVCQPARRPVSSDRKLS